MTTHATMRMHKGRKKQCDKWKRRKERLFRCNTCAHLPLLLLLFLLFLLFLQESGVKLRERQHVDLLPMVNLDGKTSWIQMSPSVDGPKKKIFKAMRLFDEKISTSRVP